MISSLPNGDPRVADLRKLYNSDPIAKALLDHYARRQRDSSELKIEHCGHILRGEGVDAPRSLIYSVFKALERMKFAQIIVGRGHNRTRIVWSHSPKAIGRTAAGTQEDIPELPNDEATCTTDQNSDQTPRMAADNSHQEECGEIDFIPHELQLRPDLTIQIELPMDLTSQEAYRVALFVRSLPFDAHPRTLKRAA